MDLEKEIWNVFYIFFIIFVISLLLSLHLSVVGYGIKGNKEEGGDEKEEVYSIGSVWKQIEKREQNNKNWDLSTAIIFPQFQWNHSGKQNITHFLSRGFWNGFNILPQPGFLPSPSHCDEWCRRSCSTRAEAGEHAITLSEDTLPRLRNHQG